MGLRYRFIDLGAISQESDLLKAIAPPASPLQTFALFGQPHSPLKNVLEALIAIGTKALLVQDSVRDPDFLAEHQAFYAKQHRVVPRLCWRLHAFAKAVPIFADPHAPTAAEVLEFLDTVDEPERQYLGFVTIRPLRHAPVGASILTPATPTDVTCFEKFPVHIAGREFSVVGTPYLQQDNAVGACAQASIWIALRTQMKRVGNTAYNPAELTLAATRYLAYDRVFPGRQGLVIEQMLEAIRSSGHDPLTLSWDSAVPTADQVVEDALPYVDSGLPVIATLHPPNGGHAVVCIGRKYVDSQAASAPSHEFKPFRFKYALASDWAESLVIHNDNTGPYLFLESGDFRTSVYCLEHTRNLVVPLPETVHLTAKEAEQAALKAVAFVCFFRSSYDTSKPERLTPEAKIVLRTYLVKRHAFRRWALEDPDLDQSLKEVYRILELPKLIWVVELHDFSKFNPTDPDQRSRIGEVIVDASADSLHGDATLCAHLTKHVLPSYSGPEGLLVLDGDNEPEKLLVLKSGNPGRSLTRPWE